MISEFRWWLRKRNTRKLVIACKEAMKDQGLDIAPPTPSEVYITALESLCMVGRVRQHWPFPSIYEITLFLPDLEAEARILGFDYEIQELSKNLFNEGVPR